jgi:hypothetical protein
VLNVAGLNELLAFARVGAEGGAAPGDGVEALRAALGRVRVPLGAADRANHAIVEASNRVAEFVIRRMVLDPIERRGAIRANLSEEASQFLVEEIGKMLRNEDGIRSPELRRASVDVLKALQTEDALLELRAVRDRFAAERDGASAAAEQDPLADDLLARIEAALAPYFH